MMKNMPGNQSISLFQKKINSNVMLHISAFIFGSEYVQEKKKFHQSGK